MRVFKWTPHFHINEESSIGPVWVNLPMLSFHLYGEPSLLSITGQIGTFLKLDKATINLFRPSLARICIEVDLLKVLSRRFWIWNGSSARKGFWQDIIYEDLPLFCNHCLRLGHSRDTCTFLVPNK
jgi:hypothetical protein